MKFSQKNIENWRSWKMSFFLVGHFEFFPSKKKKKIASPRWTFVKVYRIARIFPNFDDYPGFQPKPTNAYQNATQCE